MNATKPTKKNKTAYTVALEEKKLKEKLKFYDIKFAIDQHINALDSLGNKVADFILNHDVLYTHILTKYNLNTNNINDIIIKLSNITSDIDITKLKDSISLKYGLDTHYYIGDISRLSRDGNVNPMLTMMMCQGQPSGKGIDPLMLMNSGNFDPMMLTLIHRQEKLSLLCGNGNCSSSDTQLMSNTADIVKNFIKSSIILKYIVRSYNTVFGDDVIYASLRKDKVMLKVIHDIQIHLHALEAIDTPETNNVFDIINAFKTNVSIEMSKDKNSNTTAIYKSIQAIENDNKELKSRVETLTELLGENVILKNALTEMEFEYNRYKRNDSDRVEKVIKEYDANYVISLHLFKRNKSETK